MQFFTASVVYTVLSLAFPAHETFVPEAITSDDAVEHEGEDVPGSEGSSHLEKKSVDEEIRVVA